MPPAHVPVRIRAFTATAPLESDVLLTPEPSSDAALLFPARPAPAPAQGDVQLWLLGAALVLAVLACGAGGAAADVLPWLLAAVVVASLLPFGAELAPGVPSSLFFPPSGEFDVARRLQPDHRVVGMNAYALGPEILTGFDLPDARGYDALTPPRIARLLRAALDWPDRSSSMETLPARTDPDLRLLGLMSVGALLDWPTAPPELPRSNWPGMRRALPQQRLPVILNPAALRRARLALHAVVEPDDDAALARLRDPAFDLERRCVVAAADGVPPEVLAAPPDAAGPIPPVAFELDQPDLIRLSIAPPAPSLLLLSDTHFPGWSAWVDGVERPILRANLAFRAVPVAPGEREVEFRYEPGSFALGRAITLAALALCALLALRR